MDGERNEVEEVVQQRARPPENQPAAALALALRCPRCDSSNTKFCYYNNYSLSQPRYFCKACRRYWTQGGTLRTVPIGGGCRKAKRPRISSSSSSSSSAAAAAASLSANVGRSQNLVIPAPQPRPGPPFGGSFYAGGSFLSTLAAVQSLPGGGGNQGAGVMGGGGRFGANMALLHGVSFPSFKAPPPPQRATTFFPPRQSLVLPGRLNSWSRSVINSGPTSSSGAATSGLWSSGGGGDGDGDQTGSSYAPNQWPESNRGFNPSAE